MPQPLIAVPIWVGDHISRHLRGARGSQMFMTVWLAKWDKVRSSIIAAASGTDSRNLFCKYFLTLRFALEGMIHTEFLSFPTPTRLRILWSVVMEMLLSVLRDSRNLLAAIIFPGWDSLLLDLDSHFAPESGQLAEQDATALGAPPSTGLARLMLYTYNRAGKTYVATVKPKKTEFQAVLFMTLPASGPCFACGTTIAPKRGNAWKHWRNHCKFPSECDCSQHQRFDEMAEKLRKSQAEFDVPTELAALLKLAEDPGPVAYIDPYKCVSWSSKLKEVVPDDVHDLDAETASEASASSTGVRRGRSAGRPVEAAHDP